MGKRGTWEVLDSGKDTECWDFLLRQLKGDIYFSREWLNLHCLEDSEQGYLYHYTENTKHWVYPFILRSLPEQYGISGYDIENAYGYGGPLSDSNESGFVDRARQSFENWCGEKNVIAEFCAFHPLIQNQLWMTGGMSTFEDRKTVALSLDKVDKLSALYSRDGAYMVRRAQRGEVKVQELPLEGNFDRFVSMYREAMAGLGATDFYYFNARYFSKLRKLIEANGWLTVAEVNGEWAAASLFMHGSEYLHYHLSANNFSIKAPGATNLILDSAARRGAELGLKSLHFGGGRTPAPKDSLFKFKRSMGDRECSFIIGKMVHNEPIYQDIVGQWVETHPELNETHGNRLLKYRLEN